jgi:hypothetical protein
MERECKRECKREWKAVLVGALAAVSAGVAGLLVWFIRTDEVDEDGEEV